jgi:hypothetical protein
LFCLPGQYTRHEGRTKCNKDAPKLKSKRQIKSLMRFQNLIDNQMAGCQQPHFRDLIVKVGDPKAAVVYSFEERELYPIGAVATVDCGGNVFTQTCTPSAVWQGIDGFALESKKSRWHNVCGQVTVVTLLTFISTVPFDYFNANITTTTMLVRVALATAVGLDPASVLCAQILPTDMDSDNKPTDTSGTKVKARIEVKVTNTEWLTTKLDSPIFPALLGAQLRQRGIPVHNGEIKCEIDDGTKMPTSSLDSPSTHYLTSVNTASQHHDRSPRPFSSTSLALFALWLIAVLFYNNNSGPHRRRDDEDDEDDFDIGKRKRHRRSYVDQRSCQEGGEMDSFEVLKRNAASHLGFTIDQSPPREENVRGFRGSPTPLLWPPPAPPKFGNDIANGNGVRSCPTSVRPSPETSPGSSPHTGLRHISGSPLGQHRRLSDPEGGLYSHSVFGESHLTHTRSLGTNFDGGQIRQEHSNSAQAPPMIPVTNVVGAPTPAYSLEHYKQRSRSNVEFGSLTHRTPPPGYPPRHTGGHASENQFPDSVHSQSNIFLGQ